MAVVLFAVVEPDVVGDAVLAAVVAFVVDAAVVIDVRADDQGAVGVVVVPKTLRGELVVVLAGHQNTVNGDLVIGGVVNFQHAGAICSPAWERNCLAVAVDLVIEGDLVVVGQSRHGTIDSLLRGVVAERKRVPGAVIADAVIEIAAGLAGNAVQVAVEVNSGRGGRDRGRVEGVYHSRIIGVPADRAAVGETVVFGIGAVLGEVEPLKGSAHAVGVAAPFAVVTVGSGVYNFAVAVS